jgi:hypothetical protein
MTLQNVTVHVIDNILRNHSSIFQIKSQEENGKSLKTIYSDINGIIVKAPNLW